MRYSILILCMVLISGCANTGSQGNKTIGAKNKAEIYQLIHDNIVTKSDALRELGDPNDIDYYENSGEEKWVYNHIKKSSLWRNYIPVINFFSNGTNDQEKKIILIFTEEGILKKSFIWVSLKEAF